MRRAIDREEKCPPFFYYEFMYVEYIYLRSNPFFLYNFDGIFCKKLYIYYILEEVEESGESGKNKDGEGRRKGFETAQ
jgi:hypothetical protein